MLPSVPVHPHRLQVWRGHPGGLLRPWGARLGAPYGARRVPGFWGGAVGRRGGSKRVLEVAALSLAPCTLRGPQGGRAAPPPSRQLLAGIFRYRPARPICVSNVPGGGCPLPAPPPRWQLLPALPTKPLPAQAWGGVPAAPMSLGGCPWGHQAPTWGRSGVSHHRVTTTGGSPSARHLHAPKHLGHGAKSR